MSTDDTSTGDTSTGDTSDGRTVDWYVGHLRADAAAIRSLCDSADLGAPVAACPGWDVDRLIRHVGTVYGWATDCIVDSAPPAGMSGYGPGDRNLGDWFDSATSRLVEVLSGVDPGAATWHPFPVDRLAGVWPRRLAHETLIHRVDARSATGASDPIDPELASDGIDEYVELVVARVLSRDGVVTPTTRFHVHCTDVDGEWLMWVDDTGYQMRREHAKGDAALRGPAEAILLELWGRTSPRHDELDPVGDMSALAEWTALSGM